MGESKFACEVAGAPHEQDRSIGQGEGTRGNGLGVKNGLKAGKLENWRRRPVQPVSAMRGDDEMLRT